MKKILSLCSGYGGLDAAAEQLTGGTVAWVSDIDKGACKILAHRYPDVPNLGDFTTVDWSGIDPIYMLTAGYPCQPFSHAGKRAGKDDARHLWPKVLRCLTELRPPFALFENVRGHLSLGFDQVLADLATHDYDARWIVLRAADIGAPHGRARLFILAADARRGGDQWDLVGAGRGAVRVGGVRGEDPDTGCDAGLDGVLGMTLLPTPRATRGGSATETTQLLPTPTSSDTNGPGAHGDGGTDLRTTVSLLLTPRASDGEKGGPNQRGSSGDLMLPSAVCQLLPTPTARDGKDGQIRRELHPPDDTDTLSRALTVTLEAQRLPPTPTTADHKASGSAGYGGNEFCTLTDTTARQPERWGQYADAIHHWEAILGRPAPAPTQTSTKGNPQLSAAFVEWMMGLPAGWVDDVPNVSRNEKLKALGNGVVTQQAVEAVHRLLALDGAA